MSNMFEIYKNQADIYDALVSHEDYKNNLSSVLNSEVDFLDKSRNVARIVLEVGIHGNDDVAACKIKAGSHSGSLTEVPSELNDFDPFISFMDLFQQLDGIIL